MADYYITSTDITSVANAIRSKGGTSATLSYPTGFVSAINAIPGGFKLFGISTETSISKLFQNNKLVTYVYLPNVTTFSTTRTFEGCTNLVEVNLPVLTNTQTYCFLNCSKLKIARLNSCTTIGNYAFSGCSALTAIYLNSTSGVCSIGSNTFRSTNSTFKVYVPSSLLSSYKAASNWSSIASLIYSL